MPLVRWMLALLASSLLLPASAGAIVNGSFDGGAHPYVGIAVAGDDFCSGSLVSPTLFITAGHCTAAFAGSGETTFVTFDAHARPTSTYVTGTPYTHPDFFDVPPQGTGVPASVGHDVGVVVLDEPVELPRYASLPRLGELNGHLYASSRSWDTARRLGHRWRPAVPDVQLRPHDRLEQVDRPRPAVRALLHEPRAGQRRHRPRRLRQPGAAHGAPTSCRRSGPTARARERPGTPTGTGSTRPTPGPSWTLHGVALSRRSDRALEWPRGRRRAQKVVECDSRGG